MAFSCKTRYFCPSCQAKRLTDYLLRPSFAGTRLQFDPYEGQVEYCTSKGVKRRMDALDWIGLVTSHIPDPHEQMVRYYGHFSNASRGKRKTKGVFRGASPSPESDSKAERFSRERLRSWARR